MNRTLSEAIMASLYRVLERWDKDNPDFPILDKVQQINYAALILKTLGSQYESEYKARIKGKTTNELH